MTDTPASPGAPKAGLIVSGLTVQLSGRTIVDNVSFAVPPGRSVGLIGASGSGKTLTALALMGLEPAGAVVSGSVTLDGQELTGLSERSRAHTRGRNISMVFQEPATALDPLRRVGRQIAEPLRLHQHLDARTAMSMAADLADAVGLPDPPSVLRQFPHQLSGGQRQRVCIAIALAAHPRYVIADEPTTALDVTTEARILTLLERITEERDAGIVFVTHDLAVLARIADTAVVLSAGRVVETAAINTLLTAPQHPATVALVAAAKATARRTR